MGSRAKSMMLVAAASLAGCAGLGLIASPCLATQMGVNSSATWGESSRDMLNETLVDYYSGASWVRMNVNWKELEPERGQISGGVLSRYDHAVELANKAGLQVEMPIADGVPYWASSDPSKHVGADGKRHWDQMYPPERMRDYRRIVRFVVSHFRREGVETYEMWNEPNYPRFWKPHPNARQYTRMLKAGYRGAKAADPTARVLLGGLSGNDYRFLGRIYRNGGGGFFDAAAVHPYTSGSPLNVWRNAGGRISSGAFPAIKEVHRTMRRHGDGHKSCG